MEPRRRCASRRRGTSSSAPFDVLLVILALDALDLGDSGPGYLSALVGVRVARQHVGGHRRRASCQVPRRPDGRDRRRGDVVRSCSGCGIERPVVFVALPLMGLSMALMDALSRTLLQRSTDPRNLGPLFAALGLVVGLGQIAGSVVAQVMLAVGDVKAALVALGASWSCWPPSVSRHCAVPTRTPRCRWWRWPCWPGFRCSPRSLGGARTSCAVG